MPLNFINRFLSLDTHQKVWLSLFIIKVKKYESCIRRESLMVVNKHFSKLLVGALLAAGVSTAAHAGKSNDT